MTSDLLGLLPLRLGSNMLINMTPLTAIVVMLGWKEPWPYRLILAFSFLAFFFCGYEAAAFHVGPFADRWSFLAGLAIVPMAIAYIVRQRKR